MKNIFVTILFLAGFSIFGSKVANAQASITGPTCVQAGVPTNYLLSAVYSGTSQYSYFVVNGTFSTGGSSGFSPPGTKPVTITFTSSGSIQINSNGGSANLAVTVYPALTGGSISSGQTQTIAHGATPATINCSAPTGGGLCTTANYQYQWQQSPDNINWSILAGAISQNLSFSVGQLTTHYYRRQVLETTTNTTALSNVASVTVTPPSPAVTIVPGSISPSSQFINYNTSPAILSSVGVDGGTYAFTYQWQSSPDNVNWINAPCNALSFGPTNLTVTTYYRVAVTSGGITAFSSSAVVNVYPQLMPGTISPALVTIQSGGNPGILSSPPATGGNGTYTYTWYSSTDNITFNPITGGPNLPYYSPGALTTTTYYKVLVNSNGATVFSNTVQVLVSSAVPDMSFVRVRDILRPGITDTTGAAALTSPVDVAQTTQYFDGLGRLVQTVAMQQTPLQKDLVVVNQYDAFGREAQKYLPYAASTNDGNFKATALADLSNFNGTQFPSEQYYYGQATFEPSPLNRVTAAIAPGINWEGALRGVGSQYLINTAADSVVLWTISMTQGSFPSTTGYFVAGTLYKNLTTDEAGHQVIEYKDLQGTLLLKKVQLWPTPASGPSGWLNTYYVYDNMYNLRFVISPKAVEWLKTNSWNFVNSGGSTVANELCFRYEYDYRHRMIIKKIPGAAEEWTVFDFRNRPVLVSDAYMRTVTGYRFTRYDALNRPDSTGIITDVTNYQNPSFHWSAATNSISYPTLSGYPTSVLTQTYYDDYSWVGGATAALGSTLATTYTSNATYFQTTYNTSPNYAVPITPLYISRGQVTGTKTKVLNTSVFLFTVNFYDDRGRAIQTESMNLMSGVDTSTTQFDFSGKPLRNLLNHKMFGNGSDYHKVLTKMDYDARFRLLHVYKNIDAAASDQLISTMQYNELGQLTNKALGNSLDNLVYDYNVRGWLTGINKSYVQGSGSNYFGMELGYDKQTSVTGFNYTAPQFNGNITGTIWKSAGDGIDRKYDFTYDNVNRLTGAAFLQNPSPGVWNATAMDFSVGTLTYDANGNILTMHQKGFKVGTPTSLIDNLSYAYTANTNKLLQVGDMANDPQSQLGDFHYTGTKGAFDYLYDSLGNLTVDVNKGISSIVYNFLNLPQTITVTGKGTIQITVDANGQKLRKVTTDNLSGLTTTTNYMGPFVYTRTSPNSNPTAGIDTLQFIGHEEGRTRLAFHKYTNGTSAYGFEYDFYEKDHLGNTRILLSQQKDTAKYIATMEAAFRNTENQLFYNIPATNFSRAAATGYPNDVSVTNPNDSVARVNGSGQKVGPAIILKVMSGDKVDIGVNYYYNTVSTTNGQSLSASDLINSLANGIIGIAGTTHGTFSILTGGTSPLPGALSSYLGSNNPTVAGKPNAYLNWMLLDNQFNYVNSFPQSGAIQVGAAGLSGTSLQTPLGQTGIPITKSGYLYIYVSNATPNWDVFFDNLSVTTYSGPLLEENHYYPFGLTMAGISDKAVKAQYAENKNRFNRGSELQNKEFSDGSGLEMYETHLRELDPQLGRWWQVDSKPTMAESPYASMGNNPTLHNDPLGDSIPKFDPRSVIIPTAAAESTKPRSHVLLPGQKVEPRAPAAFSITITKGPQASAKAGPIGVEANFGSKEVAKADNYGTSQVDPNKKITGGGVGFGAFKLSQENTSTSTTSPGMFGPVTTTNTDVERSMSIGFVNIDRTWSIQQTDQPTSSPQVTEDTGPIVSVSKDVMPGGNKSSNGTEFAFGLYYKVSIKINTMQLLTNIWHDINTAGN